MQHNKKWRFQLNAPYQAIHNEFKKVNFTAPWLTIENGKFFIPVGYSWDGCSPAIKLPFLNFWLGTPDGPKNLDGRPQSYLASLCHDVLCQYAEFLPIKNNSAVNALFYRMLIEGGFSERRAKIYVSAVEIFGPKNWGSAASVWPKLQRQSK